MFRVRTPCIGVCSTGIGDQVCRGCKRFAHEVIHWNAYTPEQRLAINARLDALITQLLQPRVDILSVEKLQRQLHVQNVRYNPDQSAYSWFMDLLKAGAAQIHDLSQFGCRLTPPLTEADLPQLKLTLDEEFFVLSQVHYDRYFAQSHASHS